MLSSDPSPDFEAEIMSWLVQRVLLRLWHQGLVVNGVRYRVFVSIMVADYGALPKVCVLKEVVFSPANNR